MNIKPLGAPASAAPSSPDSSHSKAAASRERAISMLSGNDGSQEQSPVRNQNSVSAEEFSAIRAPQRQNINETTELETQVESGQNEPAKAPEDPLSSQYAQLARREKQLRLQAQKQQQSYQAKEDALKQREAALSAKDAEYKSGYISKDQLKKDTLRILNEAGVPYDQIVQQYIDETSNPIDPRVNSTISQLQAQIAELKAANEDNKSSYQKQQDDSYNAAVAVIKQDAVNLVKTNPDEYEMISATNSVNDVVDLIKRTHAEEGRIMSVEEAAEEVEKYLFEESLRLSNLKKIKARQSSASTTGASKTQLPSSNQKQQQSMKTLTNAATGSRQLSAKERAILAFKGER